MINRAATETKPAMSLPGLSSFNSSQRPQARINENTPIVVWPTWIRKALFGSKPMWEWVSSIKPPKAESTGKEKTSQGLGFLLRRALNSMTPKVNTNNVAILCCNTSPLLNVLSQNPMGPSGQVSASLRKNRKIPSPTKPNGQYFVNVSNGLTACQDGKRLR